MLSLSRSIYPFSNSLLESLESFLNSIKSPSGFCLSGKRALSSKDSFKNALVIGPTGTGKTSSTIVPSILRIAKKKPSFIIHDPSSEILPLVRHDLLSKGYAVKILNMGNLAISDGYNPLLKIRKQVHVGRMAHTLIYGYSQNNPSADPFWNSQAKMLLTLAIEITLSFPEQYKHLGTVLDVINAFQSKPERIQELGAKLSQRIQDEIRGFYSLSDRVQSGTIATVKGALSLFHLEEIQGITASDTVEIEQLRHQPMAIFIQTPIMSQSLMASLTSLFFTQVFEHLLSKLPGEQDRNVFFIVDEAATFKVDWPLILSQGRKYQIGSLLAVQTIEQLKHLYSPFEAQTILANCYAKLYFTNQSHQTAKMLSDTLGLKEVRKDQGYTERVPIMTPQEIRMMPKNKALLFLGNQAPRVTKLYPYYKTRLRRKVKPAPQLKRRLPQGEIPRIAL